MIKIKINEGRFTNALTAKAQSLNVKLPKPEQQPESVEQPVQLQEPEQQIEKDQVIQYNKEFYSFTTSAKAKKSSWHKIVDGMYELIKDENLINDLNNFATNKKQVATTAPLDPEDAPTEEASTPVTVQEVSNEINYPDLEEFKKPSLNLSKQKNLLNEKNKQLEDLAATVARLIRQKAADQSPGVGLNESTVNRWKQLAGIRG